MAEGSSDHALRAEILRIAEVRGSVKTLCPSEAARSIGGDDWRDLMPAARQIAFELAAEGRVDVTQKGEVVQPGVRGPIRVRWIDRLDAAVESGGLPAIGGPAMRALHAAGFRSLADLEEVPERDLADLHGVGPKALTILRNELERRRSGRT